MQLPTLNLWPGNARRSGSRSESGLKAGIFALACEFAGLVGLLAVQVSLYYLTALGAARLP